MKTTWLNITSSTGHRYIGPAIELEFHDINTFTKCIGVNLNYMKMDKCYIITISQFNVIFFICKGTKYHRHTVFSGKPFDDTLKEFINNGIKK